MPGRLSSRTRAAAVRRDEPVAVHGMSTAPPSRRTIAPTEAGASVAANPLAQLCTSLGRNVPIGRASKVGATWHRESTGSGPTTRAATAAPDARQQIVAEQEPGRPPGGHVGPALEAVLHLHEEGLGVDLAVEVPGPLRAAGPLTPSVPATGRTAACRCSPWGGGTTWGWTRGVRAGRTAPMFFPAVEPIPSFVPELPALVPVARWLTEPHRRWVRLTWFRNAVDDARLLERLARRRSVQLVGRRRLAWLVASIAVNLIKGAALAADGGVRARRAPVCHGRTSG